MLKRAVSSLSPLAARPCVSTSSSVLPHHSGGRHTKASIDTAVGSSKAARRSLATTSTNTNSNHHGHNRSNGGNGNGSRRIGSSTSTSLAALATMGAVVAGATFVQMSEHRHVLAAPGDTPNVSSLPPAAWATLPPNVAAPVTAAAAAGAGVATVAPAIGGVGAAPASLPPFGGASFGAPGASSSIPALSSVDTSLPASVAAAPSVSSSKSFSSSSSSSSVVEKKKNPGRLEEIDSASQNVLVSRLEPGMKVTLVKNVYPTGVDTQEASASYQYHIAQGTPLVDKQLTIQTSVSAGDMWNTQNGEGAASLDVITKLTKEHELAANVTSNGISSAYTWRPIPKKLAFKNHWTHSSDGKNELTNEVEYRGSEWTAQARQTSLEEFGVGWLHSITPRLAMGSSVTYDVEKGQIRTEPALKWRSAQPAVDNDNDDTQFTPIDTVVLQMTTQGATPQGYRASYTRSIAPATYMSTTFQHQIGKESRGTIGFRQQGLMFNYGAQVDTMLTVSSSLDLYMNEWSSFHFTGALGDGQHVPPAMFGVGITLAA